MQLKDKVAIVTGAARGIGLACARRLAAEGAAVLIADVNEAEGLLAEQQLIKCGLRVKFKLADVSRREAVEELVAFAIQSFGAIDILVANAGINRPCDFLELKESDFDDVIRNNLKSVFLCGQAVARHMVENRKSGSIVNMCSTSAIMTMPNLAAYAASKGGISALTKAMSLSLAPRNIRVNAIGPGTIVTEMTRERLLGDAEMRDRIMNRTPLGRAGTPEEVAGVALFLAGPDSTYLTGQTIYLDGGRLGLNYTLPPSQG